MKEKIYPFGQPTLRGQLKGFGTDFYQHMTPPSRLSKGGKKILHIFAHRRTKHEGWKSQKDNLRQR